MVPCVAVQHAVKGLFLAALLFVAFTPLALAGTPSDMQKALGLAPRRDASIKAIRSADWSDPATWGGRLPAEGDRVWIPQGVEVRQDVDSPRLQWLRLDGDLFPAPIGPPVASITLTLETLVTTMTSKLYTPEGYEGQWNIVFADSGPINFVEDPWAFGHGAQLMGEIDLKGREVTGYQFTTGNKPGDKTITLKNAVTGWRVGDRLVVPGVGVEWLSDRSLKDDDDLCTIAAIDGNTITLAEPLKFDHSATNRYGGARPMLAANLSPRAIDFSSENPALDRRGHVMVMRDEIMMPQNFHFCSFRDLGRTDKSRPATDPDGQGNGLGNPRARYALHYHRCKPDRDGMEGSVFGCLVVGSPGWGFVNHDSFVCMQHNVAYDCDGTHFACEIGTETGCFTGNVAIRSHKKGSKDSPSESRRGKNDWAFLGHGFWTHGGGVKMVDCIVTGVPSNAFDVMGERFNAVNPGEAGWVSFATKNLAPGDKITAPPAGWTTTRTQIDPGWVPQRHSGLKCFGCGRIGVQFWGLNPIKTSAPVIASGYLKDCYLECPIGVKFGYSSHIELSNIAHYAIAQPYASGAGFIHNGGAGSNVIRHFTDRGSALGIQPPIEGNVEITDCQLDSRVGLRIETPADVTRRMTLANLTYGAGTTTKIDARLGSVSGRMVEGKSGGWGVALNPRCFGTTAVDETTLDGKFLYYAEEAPDFALSEFKPIAASGATPAQPLPAILAGLTTRQLREQHAIGMYARHAADDITPLPGSTALVGSPPTRLPLLRVNKNYRMLMEPQVQKTNITQGFVLRVQDGAKDAYRPGAFVDAPPVDLTDKAWNVVQVAVQGQPRGVLVHCDSERSPGGAWPEPPASLNAAR